LLILQDQLFYLTGSIFRRCNTCLEAGGRLSETTLEKYVKLLGGGRPSSQHVQASYVLMLLMTVALLRCIIKVLPVFKQISPEAMDFQKLLLMSYTLHRAEMMVSSVYECNRTRWVQSLEKVPSTRVMYPSQALDLI
jgi:hypothetical protein